MIKLCVNIDHIATVRQARLSVEPSPLLAAQEAIKGGADGITVHLREDRRHIQDDDLHQLRGEIEGPLNLELAPTPEMIAIAIDTVPEMAMLVPEGRDEVTTEGGLDVISNQDHLQATVDALQVCGIPVSAFLDADLKQIEAAKSCGFSVCEIHTGPYANTVTTCGLDLEHPDVLKELETIKEAASFVQELGLQCNAGHGLTHHNVQHIASIEGVMELHIGHSIISRSVFVGIQQAVREMKERMQGHTT